MADGTRINKYLSEHGILSRRKADEEIAEGKVTINGKVAALGDRVMPGDTVVYDGVLVGDKDEDVIIMLNKPVGIVCTTDEREENNIVDYMNYPTRIYPVGRLDKNSSGLILLTNKGEIVNEMMKAANYHEKEYLVRIDKPVTDRFIKGMASGVPLRELGVTTRPCKVEKLSKYTFSITLTQGLNRQIRRMCDFFDARVFELKRVRIMNLKLGNLKLGEYRYLTEEEEAELARLLAEGKGKNESRKKN